MSTFLRPRSLFVTLLAAFFCLISIDCINGHGFATAQEKPANTSSERARTFPPPDKQTEQIVAQVFAKMHDGWSTDEVLLQDELRNRFAAACRAEGDLPDRDLHDAATSADRFYRALIHLRKRGGKLAKATRRAPRSALTPKVAAQTDTIAEIAARRIHDEFLAHTDAILVDTIVRRRFNEIAHELLHRYRIFVPPTKRASDRNQQDDQSNLNGAVDSDDDEKATKPTDSMLYHVRKSALRLRKTRQLQPELLARVTDWKRSIQEFEISSLSSRLLEIPEKPGIYIFRDGTGFVYIGQAASLRARLRSHLNDSDRLALADYLTQADRATNSQEISLELHVFEKGSPGESLPIRRAYESELIRTRRPRLNIQP